MKKLFILTLAVIALGTSAFAADNNKKLSFKGASHFTYAFNDVKEVSWTSEEDKFEKASFVRGGVQTDVFYTPQGELIGTSKTFAFDKLPKTALYTITTKYTYPTYQLQECIEFINANGDVNYYLSMDKADEKLVLEINKYGNVSVFSKERK